MPSCCVPICTNNSHNSGRRVRFFGLPRGINNINRRETWITAIGRNDLHENSKICEVHFSENQFEKYRSDGRKLLKWDAVPDLLQIKVCECTMSVNSESTTFTNISDSEPQEAGLANSTEDVYIEPVEILTEKFEPAVENLQFNKTLEQEQLINNLRKSLRKALHERNTYKKKLEKRNSYIDKLFEKDQIQFIEIGNARGQKWCENTINKSLKLYMTCGSKGYEEIRRQNLPYPSIRTLQHHLQCRKFKLDILEDIFI